MGTVGVPGVCGGPQVETVRGLGFTDYGFRVWGFRGLGFKGVGLGSLRFKGLGV